MFLLFPELQQTRSAQNAFFRDLQARRTPKEQFLARVNRHSSEIGLDVDYGSSVVNVKRKIEKAEGFTLETDTLQAFSLLLGALIELRSISSHSAELSPEEDEALSLWITFLCQKLFAFKENIDVIRFSREGQELLFPRSTTQESSDPIVYNL